MHPLSSRASEANDREQAAQRTRVVGDASLCSARVLGVAQPIDIAQQQRGERCDAASSGIREIANRLPGHGVVNRVLPRARLLIAPGDDGMRSTLLNNKHEPSGDDGNAKLSSRFRSLKPSIGDASQQARHSYGDPALRVSRLRRDRSSDRRQLNRLVAYRQPRLSSSTAF